MNRIKYFSIIILLCFIPLIGWTIFSPLSPIPQEAKNIFESNTYLNYRRQLKDFITEHHSYRNIQNLDQTHYHQILKNLIEEIVTPVTTPQEQRTSHEVIISYIRELTYLTSTHQFKPEDASSKQFVEDLIRWIFLHADLKPDMQQFLFQHISTPEGDMFAYLQHAQQMLRSHPHFQGIEEEASYEDQLLQGNLPSTIALVNFDQTQLIRIGQPICQSSRRFWWWPSHQASPEFLLFLQQQPSHFYVNLMKRHGMEAPLSKALEALEHRVDHLFLITLDKNSPFYWQNEQDYPAIIESGTFKQLFLTQMLAPQGNYFWSKHLNRDEWEQELNDLLNHVHEDFFNHQEILNQKERLDFIEITYLAILDHLVDKWNPASMNITCRQGMDRGPSLMVLWLMKNIPIEKEEIANLILTPPLMIHNRASHASRIERLVSAAQRITFAQHPEFEEILLD